MIFILFNLTLVTSVESLFINGRKFTIYYLIYYFTFPLLSCHIPKCLVAPLIGVTYHSMTKI